MTARKRKSPIQNVIGESADSPTNIVPTIHEPVDSLDHSTTPDASHLPILEQLKVFLVSAPSNWQSDQQIRRFTLHPTKETIACVLWNNLYHITGTDILKALQFRFAEFGRPVVLHKKFEEGVFSDLRNLKPGVDATLEEPRSPLLDFLFKSSCIRTQKKQKVFYWFSVPHDRLFMDALERDLKRESQGHEPTTAPIPGLSAEQTLALAREHCQPVAGYQQISSVAPTPTRVLSRRDSLASGMSITPSGIPEVLHQFNNYGENQSYLDPDALNQALSSVSSMTNSPFLSRPTLHYEGKDQMQLELQQHFLPVQYNRPRAVSLSLQRNSALFAQPDLSPYNDESRMKKPARTGRNRAVSMSSHTGSNMNDVNGSGLPHEARSDRIPSQLNFSATPDTESRRMSIAESSPFSLEIPQAPLPHLGSFSTQLSISTPKQLDTYIDPTYLHLQLHDQQSLHHQDSSSHKAIVDANQLRAFEALRAAQAADSISPHIMQDFCMNQSSSLMTPLSIMTSLQQTGGMQSQQFPSEWQQHFQHPQDHFQVQQQMLQLPQGGFSAFFNIDESPTVSTPPQATAVGNGPVGL
ncbi:homeodomain transcription factor ste12 [Entophlyctis luteolus]|nr:homeodomain transcription factor ste12 [Entophlyctis luteolus]